ncbi:hypothetical protein [Desulfocicer niacini]
MPQHGVLNQGYCMETQLLIIKTEIDYIRVKDDVYITCKLDKASVFPMEKLETVKAHVATMEKKQGWHGTISRLILREEPL